MRPQSKRDQQLYDRILSVPVLATVLFGIVLVIGTFRDDDFWSTPDQRGDALMKKGQFADAAKIYTDPHRIGVAQYRDGQFEAAAKTFNRVPGATGDFNSANSWLMGGKYDLAISLYDKALALRPNWKDAIENKKIAIARRDSLDFSDAERGEDQDEDSVDPNSIPLDQKSGDDQPTKPEVAEKPIDDANLQATWLRQVRTTPAQFLKAKFAWQAQEKSRGEEIK